jgi:hypothetical protein
MCAHSALLFQNIMPRTTDGLWGGSAAVADIAASVPEAIFIARGPEQVASQRDFVLTTIDVFVTRHI